MLKGNSAGRVFFQRRETGTMKKEEKPLEEAGMKYLWRSLMAISLVFLAAGIYYFVNYAM
jgi:hypothetical protein